jgi:DNA modification methylase
VKELLGKEKPGNTSGYQDRSYLSAVEAARYLNATVSTIHNLVKENQLKAVIAASGQQRFTIDDLERLRPKESTLPKDEVGIPPENIIEINNTTQTVYIKNAQNMPEVADNSVHLMVTSPPYYDAKMYSGRPIKSDLGNIHDLDEWFDEISRVWHEVYRVLQPGRKAFINIMNLPVRGGEGFRSLNLMGRTIEICERMGFIFKRDIVWHKTNAVRAHFGTYPYPGGILINNMHEFILEFEKPARKGIRKYEHLTREQKEQSKLDKDFWLSIKNSDVWLMKPEGSGDSRNHVAPFPYELPYRLIKAYSYISETVLDPFMGSGTTLKAAIDLGRNGIGYEINPAIAHEAIERLQGIQGMGLAC